MITPKRENSIYDLLPPERFAGNQGLDFLERMRSNFHMRKNSNCNE